MAAKDYGVRKDRGKDSWSIYDRHTKERVATSTKGKREARISAHIRDDRSRRYPK